MTTTCSIDVLPAPRSAHEPDLRALADAMNAVHRDVWANDDFRRTPRELFETLRDDADSRKVAIRARDGDALLGYAVLRLPQRDNTRTGELLLGVLPGHRGHGVGAALHAAATSRARHHGRTTLTCATDQRVEPPAGPGTVAPPTGEGLVATGDPGVRFALRHGWDVEQVGRFSVLDVPAPDDVAGWARVAGLRADAEAHSGPEYRLLAWSTPTPAELAPQLADLKAQMSTDDPHAGLDHEAESWDVGRVGRTEERFARQGRTLLVMAAEHVPTGRLAAYTDVLVPDEPGELVHQQDTLVTREHRGRRLGMLVKTANLQRLAAELPGVRRIGTWNAQENRWMLAINVALGFRPAGGAGLWQLRLDRPAGG